MTGPRMVASPMTAPSTPKARPRCRGGTLTCTTLSTWGNMRALKAPWTTRETTRNTAVGAAPQAADAAVKPTMPITKSFRRP